MKVRIHQIMAVAVLLVSGGVYLKTAAPTVSFWDCGEFISCSYTLGVPHPPGSPLYLLLGRLFTFLPIGEDAAFPVNLMSVIASAVAAMLVYLITVRLIRLAEGDTEDRTQGLWREAPAVVGGATAALMLAFSDTFWFNAVEAEVYGFSIMMMALAVWLGLYWMDRSGRPGSTRVLLFTAYLMGLSGGLHLLCLLAVPSLLMLLWFQKPDALRDPKLWALAPLLFALGYSTYVALYVRSGLNPIIDENNPENWANFMLFLKREQYGTESMLLGAFDRRAPFWDYQMGTVFLKYFLNQFPTPGLRFVTTAFRKASDAGMFPVQISLAPYVLGLWGAWVHWRQDQQRFWAMAVLFVLTGVGLTVYLNMPDPQPRERDYVFVGMFAVFAVWMGVGAWRALRWLWDKGGQAAAVPVAVLFLLMPAGLAGTLYDSHDRTGDYVAYDYAHNILASCDEGSVLFTNGDNDTFPLWFLQEVIGYRKDVRVVNLSLLNTNWYIKQLRDQQPQVQIQYTDAYIDGVLTAYTREAVMQSGRFWPEDREVTAAGMTWTVPASPYQFLRVQDVMVLKILDWNHGERPVYFAITVPEENRLNLEDHLQMEGMVYRVVREQNPGIPIERTRRHLFDVYRYRGVTDPNVHRDETAQNLLVNYQVAFLELGEHYRRKGLAEAAYEAYKRCEAVAVPPEDWKAYLLLSGAMQRIGRTDEIDRLLGRALDAKVFDQTTKMGAVADVMMEFERYEQAAAIFTTLIEKGEAVELALFNRAVARERLGQLEAALEDLREVEALAPNDGGVAEAVEIVRRKLEASRLQKGEEGKE